ncbi:hypothetical protein MTO96_036757 [Rhipicephalus appendiculatus]
MRRMELDWLAWYNTSWRNSGIVARAARFLQGSMGDRHCAAGLDRVTRHPALLAELAEVLSIDEAEARERVREGIPQHRGTARLHATGRRRQGAGHVSTERGREALNWTP